VLPSITDIGENGCQEYYLGLVGKIENPTNAVESLHMSLRKIIKTRGSFPSEEAAVKLLYLALRNVIRKWDTVQSWKQALNHFEMLWGDRIQAALSR
jgi:transposase-like protein